MQSINVLVMNITEGNRAAHAFIIEGMGTEVRAAFLRRLAQGLECTGDPAGGRPAAGAAAAPESAYADSVLATGPADLNGPLITRPCLNCPSCRQIASGTSLDVIYMNKSTGSGKTSRPSYKVSDAAEFIERLSMGSYGRYLIGIIDDADSLSEVIQNKLLKTLEEPGDNTILLLGVTNRDNLLSTVRSRCSELRMSDFTDRFTPDGRFITDSPLPSDYSGNNKLIGDCFDQAHIEEREKLIALCNMLTDRNCRFYQYRDLLEKTIKSKEDALAFIDLIEDRLRDSMYAIYADDSDTGHGIGTGTSAVTGIKQEEPDPAVAAECIELAAIAGMDIRREMQYSRALKRLYLDIRGR